MDQNTINAQFTKVIESLGYSQEELQKYLKAFDLNKKIHTIAITYSLEQRKEQVTACLEQLKSRNSLLYLLFLKNTLETMFQLSESIKNEIWEEFIAKEGIEMAWNGFNSNNSDFLNNLLELVILIISRIREPIDSERYTLPTLNENTLISQILIKVLSKYELIDKKLFVKFIGLDIDKVYLLLPITEFNHKQQDDVRNKLFTQEYLKELSETIKSNTSRCYCNTFLKDTIEHILGYCEISKDIGIVLKMHLELNKLFTMAQLTKLKNKFENQSIYSQLLDRLEKEERMVKNNVEIQVKNTETNNNTNLAEVSKKDAILIEIPNKSATDYVNCTKPLIEQLRIKESLENIEISGKCPKKTSTSEEPTSGQVEFIDYNKNKAEQKNTTQEQTSVITFKTGLFSKVKNSTESTEQVKNTKAAPLADEKNKEDKKIKPKGFGLFGKVTSTSSAGNTEIKSVSDKSTISNTDGVKLPESNVAATNAKPKFGFGARAKSFKPTLTSEKTYTNVRWKKISKSQMEIFSKISYENIEKIFNIKEFDCFESKQTVQETKAKEGGIAVQKDKCVIDPKKSYVLNIALGRVKLTNTELIMKILDGDFDNESLIKQFILYYPTADEFEQLAQIKNKESAGRAELLFNEVVTGISDAESFLNALQSLRFKFYFNNRNYGKLVKEAKAALERIKSSTELVNLFGTMLVIGNVLNLHTFYGNAEAFTLDSLSTFTNKEILSFIARKVQINRLFNELLPNQDSVCLVPTSISIDTILEEINEAKSLFGEFVDGVTAERFKDVCRDCDELAANYKQLQCYFGEKNDGFIMKLETYLKELKAVM